MIIENSGLGIQEQVDIDNARALRETVKTQNLLIQYLAEMTDVYIPQEEEGGVENVQHIEETKE